MTGHKSATSNSDTELETIGDSLMTMIKEYKDNENAELKKQINEKMKQYNTMAKADGAALRKEVSSHKTGDSSAIDKKVDSHNAVIKKYKRIIDSF